MSFKHLASDTLRCLRIGMASLALFQFAVGATLASAGGPPQSQNQGRTANHSHDGNTRTPIKHLIVIIGENRSFDHVFATYKPNHGQFVWNLLSEGIVNSDGTPGPNFSKAEQLAATDQTPDTFLLSPPKSKFPGNTLPAPLVAGAKVSYTATECDASTPEPQCAASLTLAMQSENGLPDSYYESLLVGGTGQASKTPDMRITNVNSLPAGPFQLTNGNAFPYVAYAASPVHRFYQMWQQLDCSVAHITRENPSGCSARLFPWVEVTFGAGSNGAPPAANFSTEYSSTGTTTGEGSTAMGFYNVQQGDAPYFKKLADNYAMSDNFHQSVDGGTGANHIMFGHADAIWFYDPSQIALGNNPYIPPENTLVYQGTIDQGTVTEIEDPDPAPTTNNWYSNDGYGAGSFGFGPSSGGGSYSDCSDRSQPGVKEVVKYLASLPNSIDPHCEKGHYYLLNNYNPGWFGNGKNAYVDENPNNTPFTIPPSSTRSIGDDLNDHHVSWKYYGDQWNNYVNDPYQLNYGTNGSNADEYCNICNPFQYDTSIMSHPDQVAAHIQDTLNLYTDISGGTLPAVSIVKPSGYVDGHPASSKLNLFEGFVKKIVDQLEASPYAKDTAIFITEDEGGGYYDSGYVQPLDFFGDGTRIIFLVVSPYLKPGHISHEYADHVSMVKFIERNWNLPPITHRSRDNFPNPVTHWDNPYVPVNSPALSDLFDFFDFSQHGGH